MALNRCLCGIILIQLLIKFGLVFGQNFANLSYREVEQQILESLLKPPYDSRIRPMDHKSNDTAGTVVTINMFIRSFDFIDDVNMQYSIQLTFRQQWTDRRLRFAHLNPPEKLKYLTLSRSSPIWTPDVFFSNEKSAYFHEMLVPNTFVRVFPNGDVLYSTRLSMTLSCPMQLRNFPFDVQTCFMRMASYGYTTDDLIFKWKLEDPLQLTPHLDLPRFSLDKFSTEYCDSVTTTGTYSCLLMKFGMKRDSSYYNSQIFMPCAMLVVIGWLSFWINRYEPTARLVLLIATLLVMATLIGGFNVTVPKVSYTKASDVWTVSCFLFIFAALFQYILVHYLTSCERPDKNLGVEVGGVGEVGGDRPENIHLMGGAGHPGQDRNDPGNDLEMHENKVRRNRSRSSASPDVDKLFKFYEYWTWSWFKQQRIGQKVDLISRVIYPMAFFIFNLSYWPQYYNAVNVVN